MVYIERQHRSGANGKATVPGVSFGFLGRGVGWAPGMAKVGASSPSPSDAVAKDLYEPFLVSVAVGEVPFHEFSPAIL